MLKNALNEFVSTDGENQTKLKSHYRRVQTSLDILDHDEIFHFHLTIMKFSINTTKISHSEIF